VTTSGLGVSASPRLVAADQPVPKGGGHRMVGDPYRVAGRTYRPIEDPKGYSAVGLASWYGAAFRGRLTSNGEIYDSMALSAAHPTLPLPSYVRVTNLQNGKSVVVRVNDRGPFHNHRLIDVSKMTAELLGFRRAGTTEVRVSYVGPASLGGSDDRRLMATYEVNGHHAAPPGVLLAELPSPPGAVARRPDRVLLADAAPLRPAPRTESVPLPAASPVPMPEPEPPLLAENSAPTPVPHRAAPARDPIGALLLAENEQSAATPVPRTQLAFATGIGTPAASHHYVVAPALPEPHGPDASRVDVSFRTVQNPIADLRPSVDADGRLSPLY
jgi:rare lipoprotein A